jgi:Flp pilus assembly protein TadB
MADDKDLDLSRSGNADAASGRSGPSAKFLAFLVLVAVAVIFVLQNRDRKPVDFLVFEINSRQWVNIAVAILLGVVLDRLFLGWWRRRRRNRNEQNH